MTPSIKILVLNWNGADLTKDCLESLSKVRYANYSVVVIDNHSTDDSATMIREAFPKVELMVLEQNYGFAGGYNRAIEKLAEPRPDFYLLLNNDTLVAPDFLNPFAAASAQYGRRNIFGAKIFYAAKPDLIWYAGGRVRRGGLHISHVGIRELDSERFSRDSRTDYITGCCLVISPALFEELGGFDERFGMYAEDVDLCLRARQAAAECYMIPASHIYHRVSASVGGNLTVKKNLRKLISWLRLIKKHGLHFNGA